MKNSKLITVVVIILIIIDVGGYLIYYYSKNKGNSSLGSSTAITGFPADRWFRPELKAKLAAAAKAANELAAMHETEDQIKKMFK